MHSLRSAHGPRTAHRRGRLALFTTLIAIGALFVAPGAVFANDAHLTIVKTFDSPTVTAPGTVGFTITVQIHPDPGPDALCVVLVSGLVQCPAHNVTLTDKLPTTPAGLNWSIDAARSNRGCDIGVTTPGVLTCKWGSLIAENETRTVHVVSPIVGGAAGMCGPIINPIASVSYNWEDGTVLQAQATNAQTVVTCPTVTPTPTPTPSGSVRGATSPPRPSVTLPPTDASMPPTQGPGPGTDLALILIVLLATAAGALVTFKRWPTTR